MPINPDNAEEFDPVHGVPIVSQLLMELDQSDLNTASTDMQVSHVPIHVPIWSPLQSADSRLHLVYIETVLMSDCEDKLVMGIAESMEVHSSSEGCAGFPFLLS